MRAVYKIVGEIEDKIVQKMLLMIQSLHRFK
jgi:hypothetical protein